MLIVAIIAQMQKVMPCEVLHARCTTGWLIEMGIYTLLKGDGSVRPLPKVCPW